MEINIFGLRVFLELPYRSFFLLLILNALVIITYFFMLKLREDRIIKFGNFETLKRVEGYKRFSLSPVLLILKVFIITLLFLVATNSIKLNLLKPVSNTDFVLAMDTSSSMLTPDYQPNRLETAKRIAMKWLYNLPESTRVGIVVFSGNATKVLEPTTNYRRIKNAINNISASETGGTAIGTALLTSASMLNFSNKQKAIVLITDGKNNEGVDVNNTVGTIARMNIVVYTIGIGNNNRTREFFTKMQSLINKTINETNISFGTNYNMSNIQVTYSIPEIDTKTLEYIANNTGGVSFIVENETSLEEAFSNIFLENERVSLDSDYYILLFISILIILELIIFAKYGAI